MGSDRKVIFERITRDHGGILGRIVESYAPPGPDRDDLAQDVGLAIWKALKLFRGDCSERTFVIRIAHNRGLSFVFQKRRVQVRESVDVTDDRPSPEEVAGNDQRREVLLAAIRMLPVGYRQVLTLALEELPQKKIAQIIGISPQNVAVRLNRARGMLEKRIRRYHDR